MRAVTLKELSDWIERNKHRTWHHSSWGVGPTKTHEIKYLTFSLDTRDMEIWSLSTDGMGKSVSISIRDDNHDDSRTILDELESKLDKAD